MRVLVVEDDENKRHHLVSFLIQMQAVQISTAVSYSTGLRAIVEGASALDLILLDMSLPTFDISANEHGGGSEVYGGREILEQMSDRGIKIPVIVVTQYDQFGEGNVTLEQLDRQLKAEYADTYRGSVFYNTAREGWRVRLQRMIANIGFPKGKS
jgi:CheY-like chemotaxis protein